MLTQLPTKVGIGVGAELGNFGQKIWWFKNICGSKKFWGQKTFSKNFFNVKNFFMQNFFWDQKIFWVKDRVFGRPFFWVK